MSEQFPTPMADELIGGYTREALLELWASFGLHSLERYTLGYEMFPATLAKLAELQRRVEAQDKRLAIIDKDVEFLNKADWANDMETGIKWRDQLIAELQQQGARLCVAVDQMESAYKLASTARDTLQGQVAALRGLLERFRDRPNSRELQVEIQRVLGGDGKEQG